MKLVENVKKMRINARSACIAVFAAVQAAPLCAQQSVLMPNQLSTLTEEIYKAFTGDVAKFILIFCLCGCAIAYGFNKDNDKLKKGIIAIGVAAVVLMIAQGTVGYVMSVMAP
jgi:hypothetical protein